MSYLNAVRLVFSGAFQADPSTVNNDVRHYDNRYFDPSYQDYGMDHGWWNPNGTGAFRLLDCKVRAVYYADGTSTDNPAVDPVVGLDVLDSNDRSCGKIVDLDPQWQLASQIWGMKVRLAKTGGDVAANWLESDYAENPFRDLWFNRVLGMGGDAAASATFQSVLTGPIWGEGMLFSRFLRELRSMATQKPTQKQQLSIRLVTYAYRDDHTKPGFTTGIVSGVIGPWLAGEPESIVVGRRFVPQFGTTSWNNINLFTGVLNPDNNLILDLCNALPIDINYRPLDLGRLSVGVLTGANTPEGAPVGVGNFVELGEIPYQEDDWLLKSAGVAMIALTEQQASLCSQLPLAIVAQPHGSAQGLVAIRETTNGLFVGADPFVVRIDASNSGPVVKNVTLYASAYGAPAPFAELQIAPVGEMDGLGTGSTNNLQAPTPAAGVPYEALSVPGTLTTDANGVTSLPITGLPPNNPRGYIDGQLYNINYQQAGQTRGSFGQFEVIAVHLRDAVVSPVTPTWEEDIRPIFTQYGNLYPVMSRWLVQLSDPKSVYAHRKLLELAFSLELNDPNYMPVTRDLSAGKRDMILAWLAAIESDAAFMALVEAPASPSTPPHSLTGAAPAPVSDVGSKEFFAKSLARSRRAPR